MLCPSCGQENREGAQFCIRCGSALGAAPRAEEAAKSAPMGSLEKHKFAIAGGVGGLILLCLLILCIAVAALFVVPGLTGGKELLLAFPSSGGDVDLYVLKLGQNEKQWKRVAEDAEEASLLFELIKNEEYHGTVGGDFGGFMPGTDRLFLWYHPEGDNDVLVQQMRVGDERPIEILESDADHLAAGVFSDSGLVALREIDSGKERCYVAKPGQEAERLVSADHCIFSSDGTTVMFNDLDKKGEATLSVLDVSRRDEKVVVDGIDGFVSASLSSDGSHIAYLQADKGEYQLFLIDRRSGDETEVTNEVAGIYYYTFVPYGDALYYTLREDEDDDEVRLYAQAEGDRPIAEGARISIDFSPDGRYMLYVIGDDDGDETLYVRPVGGGADVEIAGGEDIDFKILPTHPARLVVVVSEEDEITLLSTDPSGKNVVELLTEDRVSSGSVAYIRDGSILYVRLEDEDGEDSLYVTPVNREGGFYLLEKWSSLGLEALSPNGRTLVFWAVEESGDDPVLYSIEVKDGAEPVKLDDDGEGFINAVFMPDGRRVLYSVDTGDDADDREVRRVRADGGDKYEVLYEKAVIVDARWADLVPFSYLGFR